MKKLLLLLFSLMLSFNSYGEAKLDFSSGAFCDQSPKAQVRDGLFYLPNTEKPYSGENLCVYLSNGQYHSRGEIKQGLKDGQWTYWYENGELWKKERYENGEKLDYRKIVIDNENVFHEEIYVNGDLVEEIYTQFLSMIKLVETNIVHENGEKNATQTFFSQMCPGQKTAKGKSNENYRYGKWTIWVYEDVFPIELINENSFLDIYDYPGNCSGIPEGIIEGSFKEGNMKYGTWTNTQVNGQKIWEANYKDGNEESIFAWHKNGEKWMEVYFYDGSLVNRKHTQWYENGQIEFQQIVRDGECVSGDC